MPILNGVDEILDHWLGLTGNPVYGNIPKFNSKQAGIDLSNQGGPLPLEGELGLTPENAISQAMQRIGLNHLNLDAVAPSESNWEWKKSHHLSPNSRSPEKVLEKLVTFLFGTDWVNQIPVCNGFPIGQANARRIDLAYRRPEPNRNHYELIELKFGLSANNPGANHPLYAAMEVLEYGLLYIFFRQSGFLNPRPSPRHHLLDAETVDLVVLAPENWYKFRVYGVPQPVSYHLSWLEEAITEGLSAYLNANGLPFRMSFRFESFPAEVAAGISNFMETLFAFREEGFLTRVHAMLGD